VVVGRIVEDVPNAVGGAGQKQVGRLSQLTVALLAHLPDVGDSPIAVTNNITMPSLGSGMRLLLAIESSVPYS
jgi:hypothetical protein